MKTTLPATLATALLLSGPLSAHDSWLTPELHVVKPGTILGLRLFTGHLGELTEFPHDPERLERLEAWSATALAPQPLAGRVGAAPFALARFTEPGLRVIGFQSRAQFVDLDAVKFESYLAEEGLDHAIQSREAASESAERGLENYTRCAKTLVQVGEGPALGFERVLGMPLEIVPQINPLEPGTEAFRFLVLDQGRPAIDTQVELTRLDAASHEPHLHLQEKGAGLDEGAGLGERAGQADHEHRLLRTNAKGEFELQDLSPGRYLVHTITIRRASPGERGDWTSFWASLSFEAQAVAH